jgi:hypothetical protein
VALTQDTRTRTHRRAISEVGKWINYVTNNRFLTISADLSNSINVRTCAL